MIMSVTMRIIQEFDPCNERDFMALEREFAELERRRPDYPNGTRLQPISAADPCHTLVWECKFPDLEAARAALHLFEGDADHEALAEKQSPYFRRIRVEFYENLDL
jgi:hypothetical protein